MGLGLERRAFLGLGAASVSAASASLTVHAAPAAASVSIKILSYGRFDYRPALARLSQYIAHHRETFGLPGIATSIADKDGFTALIYCGLANIEQREPFTPSHLIQIGSISKSMTSLCVFRLIQAGRLALATPVRDVLPDVPWPDGPPITVAHLLNHSSGLPDEAPIFPRSPDGRLWRGFPPGSFWSYSNTGYQLLGLMLERIENRSVADIIRTDVLEPLGMDGGVAAIRAEDRLRYATGYSPYVQDQPPETPGRLGNAPWVDVTGADGCVAATPAAMASYIRYLINAGQGLGAPLLDDVLATTFCAPTIDAPGWAEKGARYANGLAVLNKAGRTLLHHTGGMVGFSSSLTVDSQAGVGAFASTNVGMIDYRPRAITAYACELFRRFRDAGELPSPPPLGSAESETASLIGRFQSAAGEVFEIKRIGGALRLVLGGAQVVLEPTGEDQALAHHPRFARYAFLFQRRGSAIVGMWWGPTYFSGLGQSADQPNPSSGHVALAGRYDNDDPWRGTMRVVARHDGLWLDGVTPLAPLEDGEFRVGADPRGPERISFDAFVGGRPQRLVFSGADFLRRAEPP